ncbi:hypothetical protein P154DRAFT_578870 [Amniculicola lignicola CBS 123094]|uniref:C2H2 type master regulator of conidiophore development brlA n=1 Tax=Amniculicola lignicola CBS 123094 TaxID=1392246 RepID=A0A6A5W9J1_9PLEO|nr:hypothetical protein P154DRAFT_578870 [Amniculicola lignicola CBS 123094]
MSTDHDVEIRIRDFRNFTIAALRNFAILIVLVGMLWLCTQAVPSTIPMPILLRWLWSKAVPSAIPIPFLFRWAFIVCLYLGFIAKNALLFQTIIVITRTHMSDIEEENRSQNRDLGTRTTNLEDWILANFCIISVLSTTGFVTWYWIKVIALTVQTFSSWIYTMGRLYSLFWLLKRTARFYQEAKGVKHKEAWGILTGVSVLRFNNKFEGPKAKRVLGRHLNTGRIDVTGPNIGRGPLFDRLPDEWKAARRACKTLDDVKNPFAMFAGQLDEEGRDQGDAQDHKDVEEACFSPSVFEWQPNPVMFPHLRGKHLQALNSDPPVAQNMSDCRPVDTAGTSGIFCPDMAVAFDGKGTTKNYQKSPGASIHTGPTIMSTNLSLFACPQCSFISKRKFELNKHVNQTHNHRFKCAYQGCEKTFGLRANLERHEAIHNGRVGFQCSNLWCKTPEKIFTREDNLKRHMKLCVTYG